MVSGLIQRNHIEENITYRKRATNEAVTWYFLLQWPNALSFILLVLVDFTMKFTSKKYGLSYYLILEVPTTISHPTYWELHAIGMQFHYSPHIPLPNLELLSQCVCRLTCMLSPFFLILHTHRHIFHRDDVLQAPHSVCVYTCKSLYVESDSSGHCSCVCGW